jgi:hypothetical protein
MATWAEGVARIAAFEPAGRKGAEAAAGAMARVYKDEVKTDLRRLEHPFSTRTPSAPDTPPAMISGQLADSVLAGPAVEDGPARYRTSVAPHVAWAGIQEEGGPMAAHTPLGMRWMEPPGVWHKSMAHSLPARPYMRPAAQRMAADGTLRDAALAAFAGHTGAVAG